MAKKKPLMEPEYSLHNKGGSDLEPTDLWDWFFFFFFNVDKPGG